jgi:hypothetical protein
MGASVRVAFCEKIFWVGEMVPSHCRLRVGICPLVDLNYVYPYNETSATSRPVDARSPQV